MYPSHGEGSRFNNMFTLNDETEEDAEAKKNFKELLMTKFKPVFGATMNAKGKFSQKQYKTRMSFLQMTHSRETIKRFSIFIGYFFLKMYKHE